MALEVNMKVRCSRQESLRPIQITLREAISQGYVLMGMLKDAALCHMSRPYEAPTRRNKFVVADMRCSSVRNRAHVL